MVRTKKTRENNNLSGVYGPRVGASQLYFHSDIYSSYLRISTSRQDSFRSNLVGLLLSGCCTFSCRHVLHGRLYKTQGAWMEGALAICHGYCVRDGLTRSIFRIRCVLPRLNMMVFVFLMLAVRPSPFSPCTCILIFFFFLFLSLFSQACSCSFVFNTHSVVSFLFCCFAGDT